MPCALYPDNLCTNMGGYYACADTQIGSKSVIP
jgi:hypothetical protein